MSHQDDGTRLRHMLEAAREARQFAAGLARGDLDRDRRTTLAIVYSLQIVGEAAANVSPQRRAALPGIPWARIIGMRNRLVHAYFGVNLNVVWETVQHDLPPLIAELVVALDASGGAGTP